MTYKDVLELAAADLNDQERQIFTDAVLLPYLNMARAELEETYELNNMPATNRTSAVISVPAGTSLVGFGTNPGLPADLVEIQNVYQSQSGQNNWIPVPDREFITGSLLGNTQISQFTVYEWGPDGIRVQAANQNIDLKLDYVASMFAVLTLNQINQQIPVRGINSYLHFRTASFAALYIGENPSRAEELEDEADKALRRGLGIGIKGKQNMTVRRRPFRISFKRFGRVY